MLSGLALGGSRGKPLKSGSDDWPVCAGHAHALLMGSFFTCPIGFRGARVGLLVLSFRGIPAAPPAQVSRDVTADTAEK